jgi:hypothetical protein
MNAPFMEGANDPSFVYNDNSVFDSVLQVSSVVQAPEETPVEGAKKKKKKKKKQHVKRLSEAELDASVS